MRNLNCHIRHICHTAVYALELQRVAMVTDSVTDTVTDFCQSCTYATASFYMHDVGSFTQWNSLFRPVNLSDWFYLFENQKVRANFKGNR